MYKFLLIINYWINRQWILIPRASTPAQKGPLLATNPAFRLEPEFETLSCDVEIVFDGVSVTQYRVVIFQLGRALVS